MNNRSYPVMAGAGKTDTKSGSKQKNSCIIWLISYNYRPCALSWHNLSVISVNLSFILFYLLQKKFIKPC